MRRVWTSSAEAASAHNLEGKLERALRQLGEMGFHDAALNRDVLLQTDHDAQRAIGLLLEMGGAPSGRYGGPPSNAAAHDTTQHV